MSLLTRILAFILALITPFLSILTYDITAFNDKEVVIAENNAGGFIKGVCHLEPDYELIKQANIGWYRVDIPFPYNSDGSISYEYIEFKNYIKGYVDEGIKIFAVTPYPGDYINYGLDPRKAENKEKIQEIAKFYVEDLKEMVGAFQITNEMGVERFTLPLTLQEAADFIGMQLEAMYPIKDNIVIGYNLGGLALVQLPFEMKKYHQYCDYVGVDMYLGSFDNLTKNINQYIVILNFVRLITKKPIILCEFGYMGYGESKTDEEKAEILKQYGFDSVESAKENIDEFVANLPEKLKNEILQNYSDLTPEERAEIVFTNEYLNHIYRQLPDDYGLYKFEHTPEGQAEFFEEIISKVMKLDYVIGMFVYCWKDTSKCYVCGQEKCPVETGWGLLDENGEPKPAYYAVQKAYS